MQSIHTSQEKLLNGKSSGIFKLTFDSDIYQVAYSCDPHKYYSETSYFIYTINDHDPYSFKHNFNTIVFEKELDEEILYYALQKKYLNEYFENHEDEFLLLKDTSGNVLRDKSGSLIWCVHLYPWKVVSTRTLGIRSVTLPMISCEERQDKMLSFKIYSSEQFGGQ